MNVSTPTASKYDIISVEGLTIIDIVINCTMLNIVALLGIIGNIILSYQGLDDSTNVILLSLSFVDLAYVAALPVRRISCLVNRFDFVMAREVDAYVNMFLAVPLRLLSLISSSRIVLISAERTAAVYLPLLVTRLFSVRNTVACLIFLYAFWIILAGPLMNMFSVALIFYHTLNRTMPTLIFSDFFISNMDSLLFYNTNIRGPVSLLFILLSTGIKLQQASRKRFSMTSSTQKPAFDLNAVKMLLTVCLVYLGISVPGFIPIMMYYIDDTFYLFEGRMTLIYYASEYLIDFLLIVNSSVNFLIYFTMSKKFSRTYSLLAEKCFACKKAHLLKT